MEILKGKYNQCLIMTDYADESTKSQLYSMLNNPAFQGTQIRIMADCHAGKGSVVGFTTTLNNFIIPSTVGVDIGCGIEAYNFGNITIDYSELDKFIRRNIPLGQTIRSSEYKLDKSQNDFKSKVLELSDKTNQKNKYVLASLGTLGSGNHFLEVDEAPNGDKWIVVHTGSRHFGYIVCAYHENVAKKVMKELYGGDAYKDMQYLPMNYGGNEYIADMQIAQEYAVLNRKIIIDLIKSFLKKEEIESIKSIHNYINLTDNILRKGAISAQLGEKLLIPLNMRDGTLVCTGKGSRKWNYSAPHGAGRVFSRGEAKRTINLEDFEKSMDGIWTSSVCADTLDESPFAYKPMEQIMSEIGETVDINFLMKPKYSLKASK